MRKHGFMHMTATIRFLELQTDAMLEELWPEHTAAEVRGELKRLRDAGYEIMPLAGCDNFDKVKGCLGHPEKGE